MSTGKFTCATSTSKMWLHILIIRPSPSILFLIVVSNTQHGPNTHIQNTKNGMSTFNVYTMRDNLKGRKETQFYPFCDHWHLYGPRLTREKQGFGHVSFKRKNNHWNRFNFIGRVSFFSSSFSALRLTALRTSYSQTSIIQTLREQSLVSAL